LGELEVSGVVGQQTRGLVGRRAGEGGYQANLRVDVEYARGTAGRHDSRGALGLVGLEVVAVDGAHEALFRSGLAVVSY
jgi:hypothetical protein